MATDPKYGSDMDRFRNFESIDAVVKEWIGARTTEEVIRTLEQARVPCGPLQTVDQLLTDPRYLPDKWCSPLTMESQVSFRSRVRL